MSDPTETFSVEHFQGGVGDALRAIAQRFDEDDDLVLIGLWNIEPTPSWSADSCRLQVVLSHYEPRGEGC